MRLLRRSILSLVVVGSVAAVVAKPMPAPNAGKSRWPNEAERELEAKRKMTPKQFERSLQSPIGKGRLE